jgi:hypothetical protein
LAGDQFPDREDSRGPWRKGFFRGMRALGAAMALVAVMAASPVSAPGRNGTFQKGMVLGIFSRTDPGYFTESLKEMGDLGVDSVSLIVPKVQKNVRSTGFHDDPWITPADGSLRLAAREAHLRGMRVFLFPIVYIEDLAEGEWRGTLAPADWDEWFRVYEKMILHYARIAAEERVEYFSVGSELCSTEGFEERWRRVIRKVRRAYPGRITYSANWDHLDPVTFGDALDFLGMNAYYEVGKDDSSDVDSMVSRWKEIQKGIRRWQAAHGGKALVITEIGYPSRAGAGKDPWNYFGEGEPDQEEQRKCYEAFVRAWKGERMLSGVYFYLWWGEGGPGDRDYTPRGKSALSVIRAWYRGREVTGSLRGPEEARQ